MTVIKSTLFFFSSRRRHTSGNCDWSSDVCSSDLDGGQSQDAAWCRRRVPGPLRRPAHADAVRRQPGRGHVVGGVYAKCHVDSRVCPGPAPLDGHQSAFGGRYTDHRIDAWLPKVEYLADSEIVSVPPRRVDRTCPTSLVMMFSFVRLQKTGADRAISNLLKGPFFW